MVLSVTDFEPVLASFLAIRMFDHVVLSLVGNARSFAESWVVGRQYGHLYRANAITVFLSGPGLSVIWADWEYWEDNVRYLTEMGKKWKEILMPFAREAHLHFRNTAPRADTRYYSIL